MAIITKYVFDAVFWHFVPVPGGRTARVLNPAAWFPESRAASHKPGAILPASHGNGHCHVQIQGAQISSEIEGYCD